MKDSLFIRKYLTLYYKKVKSAERQFESVKFMNSQNNIIVSVCMITYNHEDYIEEAIESVLKQKTEFRFELIIGEDWSTDRTRNICIKYAQDYPTIIKLLPTERNYGAMQNFIRTCSACTGKFIAILEGDDFWTDSLKLQKQVSYLENNADVNLVFHTVNIVNQNSQVIDVSNETASKFEINDLITEKISAATCSALFRRKVLPQPLPAWLHKAPVGDYFLWLLVTKAGKGFCMPDNMGAYRKSDAGIWSVLNEKTKAKHYLSIHRTLKHSFTGATYSKAINHFKKSILFRFRNILYPYFTSFGKIKFSLFLFFYTTGIQNRITFCRLFFKSVFRYIKPGSQPIYILKKQ